MKSIFKVFICLALLCDIVGCGSGENNKGTELVIGSTNTVENYADFSLKLKQRRILKHLFIQVDYIMIMIKMEKSLLMLF